MENGDMDILCLVKVFLHEEDDKLIEIKGTTRCKGHKLVGT